MQFKLLFSVICLLVISLSFSSKGTSEETLLNLEEPAPTKISEIINNAAALKLFLPLIEDQMYPEEIRRDLSKELNEILKKYKIEDTKVYFEEGVVFKKRGVISNMEGVTSYISNEISLGRSWLEIVSFGKYGNLPIVKFRLGEIKGSFSKSCLNLNFKDGTESWINGKEYVYSKGAWFSKGAKSTKKPDLLAKWEEEAPANIKREINTIRTGGATQKALAAIELRKYGSNAKGAISALIDLLRDKTSLQWRKYDRYGRYEPLNWTTPAQEAAETLIKIGNPAVEALIGALKDENLDARKKAIWVLGEIKDPRAVDPLIAALNDKNLEVRSEASWALRNIIGKDFGLEQDPLKWQKWWDQNKDEFLKGR